MRIGLDAVAQEGHGKSSNSQDIVKIERTSVPGRCPDQRISLCY